MTKKKPEQLFAGIWGIEREALRIGRDGGIASSVHPDELCIPEFDRDFAEAQLEIITPPVSEPAAVFSSLRDQTRKAYAILEKRTDNSDELLWPFSMPVPVKHPELVELGYKKDAEAYLYRKGLASRYGVRAQLVSGIHYNFSFSPDLIREQGCSVDEVYFHVIRNLYRSAWALILLFGASPRRFDRSGDAGNSVSDSNEETGVCKSYLHSLRTGPSGYSALNSELPEMRYSNSGEYRAFVEKAISTPSSRFRHLVPGVDQLNGNIAQKESEVYLPFRYRNSQTGSYLEIRLFDVNPFIPWGIDENGILLVHLFIIKALLDESPLFTEPEWKQASELMKRTSLCARAERVTSTHDDIRTLADVFDDFNRIVDAFQPDEANRYRNSIAYYRTILETGDLLSERIEREIMVENGDAMAFGLRQAEINRKEALHG